MALLSVLERLGMFEDVTADLYPYRFVITPLALLVALGVAYLMYRMGVHRLLLRHRLATTLIGVPALVIALIVGNYLLSPLWERSHLEEASPLAAVEAASQPTPQASPATTEPAAQTSPSAATESAQPPAGASTSAGFQPRVVRTGDFVSADDFHFGRGDAHLIQTGPDSYVLRFENFSVRNGPDLYVYLSEDAGGGKVSEMLNLGKLKATDGAFNYEIPASFDVTKVKSAVVWCRQFAVLFTHAELM
ncbi:MAG TPA: DM13 domain-containing protein [Dehalococcoidia bacterium]|jgi:hypothetical protein